jgi:hypothetical protein
MAVSGQQDLERVRQPGHAPGAVLGRKKGEVWPSLATSAKAYGEIRRKFIGGKVEWTEVRNIPLWHCNVFQSDGGETSRNITLARQGILHIRDLMVDGAIHKEGKRG